MVADKVPEYSLLERRNRQNAQLLHRHHSESVEDERFGSGRDRPSSEAREPPLFSFKEAQQNHGADAIAGVINFQLKDDRSGPDSTADRSDL